MEVFGAVVATFSSTTALVEAVQPGAGDHAPWLLEWWPLLAAAGVGLVLWGELRGRVRELEAKTNALAKMPAQLAELNAHMKVLLQVTPLTVRRDP
jgi:hypothetical protein